MYSSPQHHTCNISPSHKSSLLQAPVSSTATIRNVILEASPTVIACPGHAQMKEATHGGQQAQHPRCGISTAGGGGIGGREGHPRGGTTAVLQRGSWPDHGLWPVLWRFHGASVPRG